MKRIDEPVQTFRVRLLCSCGGEMEPTGMTLLSNPPQFPHICVRCGREENSLDRSGQIVFKVQE